MKSVRNDLPSMALDVHKIEAVFGIKPRNWKRELERRLQAGIVPQPGEHSLAIAGYPELYRVTFFLTDAGLERWQRSRNLLFPPICCVCGANALTEVDSGGVKIPHCTEHGSGRGVLLIESGSLSAKTVWVTLTGLNDEFLQETVRMNADGDVLPPWEAFPEYDSYSGFWKQAGEFWIAQVFGPFWKRLSNGQKAFYLQKWHANSEWREWLNAVFGDHGRT